MSSNYRRYWDLEERDRAALSAEDVKTYLDVELMERGVLRPRPPVLEPISEVELATRTMFGIKYDSYHELDVVFPTAEAAAAFVALGAMLVKTDYQAGSAKYLEPLSDAAISTRNVTTKEAALAGRAVLRENNARKERNEKAQQEYEKAVDAVDKETRAIWDDWHECRRVVAGHARVLETWVNYVAMARGDEQVAGRFLFKAFTQSQVIDAFKFAGVELPTAPQVVEQAPAPAAEEASPF